MMITSQQQHLTAAKRNSQPSAPASHVKRYGVALTSVHEVRVQRFTIHVPCYWDWSVVVQIDLLYCLIGLDLLLV